MFTIYPQLANRLRSKVTALRTIDYDQGQLSNPEQATPLDYPACLISVEGVKWAEKARKTQRGSCTIGITVAIRPTIHSTGQTSPDLYRYPAMMQAVNDVFTALTGYKGGDVITGTDNEGEEVETQGASFTGLTRSDTQRMKRWDNIQAYTHLFRCDFTESSAKPVYVKPNPQLTEADLGCDLLSNCIFTVAINNEVFCETQHPDVVICFQIVFLLWR